MLKRRPKSKNSFLLIQSSSRGSDIVKPNNTSLVVNASDTETDELPKEITSVLLEAEIEDANRHSTSLMKSLSQKTQSTPKKQLCKSNVGLIQNKDLGKYDKNPSASNKNFENNVITKQDDNYFLEIVKACGASPMSGDSSYSMSEDQAIFSMKVNDKLKGNKEEIDRFLASFKNYVEKPENFQKMLVHTLTSDDCKVGRGPVQEPLLRMLINVDCLRLHLINFLLQKIADIILDEEDSENTQIIPSILLQIRFLGDLKEIQIAQKLFEIIHVAPVNVQREVIFMLPEIISSNEMEEVSTQLVDMLKYDDSLTIVIVDTIANLTLSKEVQSQVRKKILNRLDKSPIEFLPSLVQFVLSKSDAEDYLDVVDGIRENLPFTEDHFQINEKKNHADEDSYKKLIFESLKLYTIMSKQLTDIWLKVITSVNCSNDFRSLDLVFLVILFSSLHGKKSNILTIIRNKVKSLVLTETHVVTAFKTMHVIIMEYFSSVLEIASALLRSIEQVVADFGALLYKNCFIHFKLYKGQSVINELLIHIGTGSPSTINTALDTLKSLSQDHKEMLSKFIVSIMGLMNKIFDLDLTQTRNLVDIIAGLILYQSPETNLGLQDELIMFIQKQLGSSIVEISKKGVVAAVMLGKHAGSVEQNMDFNHVDINALLETAMNSIGSCEVKRGFFNDEFATMMHTSVLTETFLNFWSSKIQTIVLNNLLVRNIDVECEYFPMSLQYSLDMGGERRMVFPVVKFIIASNADEPMFVPVPIIPSMLKLIWSCEKNLTSIMPIFSASVIMPEITVYDTFHTFDDGKKKKIIDCLFLCVNYLIECVNAFCTHGSLEKALFRLKQLISVRKLIGCYTHLVIGHTPPLCQFYFSVQKITKKKVDGAPNKGRKRKIDGSDASMVNQSSVESQIAGTSTAEPMGTSPPARQEENYDFYEGYLRQLHVSCIKILEFDLKFDKYGSSQFNGPNIFLKENDWSSQTKEKLQLNTVDALYILEVCIRKSEKILMKSKQRNFNLKTKESLPAACEINPEQFITDAIKILPGLLKKMEVWSSFCGDLLDSNEGIIDGPGMFPKDSRDVKLALAAALKFIEEIISWQGFKLSANRLLLKGTLTILSKKKANPNEGSNFDTIQTYAKEAANYLSKFSKNILVLSGGLSMIKAIQICESYGSGVEFQKPLAELCHEMLLKPWFSVDGVQEKGSVYNQHVSYLLKTYFAASDNKLQVVKNIAQIALDEVTSLTDNNTYMSTIRTINKSNFPLLYRVVCEALVLSSSSQLSGNASDQTRLQVWATIIEIMIILVNIVKINSSRNSLALLLKSSQAIINLFFSTGMPTVEAALRVTSVEVLKLLKSLQTVTRFLHSVCCHSKITSDSLVAAHVPGIRAQCERLTLEVKGMLVMNKIPMECITIAILKNKDLKGNDIISQESMYSVSDEEDSELPASDTEEFGAEDAD